MVARSRPFHTACAARDLLRRLARACDGAEAIEFALSAIPLFMLLLGVVEFARLYWTQSELQYAAEAAARCATISCCGSTGSACNGSSSVAQGVQYYAAQQVLGISASANISNFQLSTAACGNQISFSYTFRFIVGSLIPNSPITLSVTACNQA